MRRATQLAAFLVIAGSIALLVFFVARPRDAERYTAGARPRLFNGKLDPSLLRTYPRLFGIAHNSGDSVRATRRALGDGADMIEVDVILLHGTLYAGHQRPPLPIVGNRLFRGPTLATIWNAAARADAIELDLKGTSASYSKRLRTFLLSHRDHRIAVSSGSIRQLRAIRQYAPWVIRLRSITTGQQLEHLIHTPGDVAVIDGVSIRRTALKPDSAAWLHAHRLLAFAWVVNNLRQLNPLVREGIDAATTDNLAILKLLGGHRRAESALRRMRTK